MSVELIFEEEKCTYISIGQMRGLINPWLQVRVLLGAPIKQIDLHWGCRKKDLQGISNPSYAGSSPVSPAILHLDGTCRNQLVDRR